MTPPPAGRRKRSRRTAAQIGALEARIYAILASDYPQSVRHVFYRLVDDPELDPPVPKTEQGYKQVGNRLVVMRRTGKLSYGWISDSTRMGYHVTTFQDADDFLARTVGLYRTNEWDHCDTHVEVWCESRSLAGVIRRTCSELGVSLYPAAGFASETFIYEAASEIEEIGKPVVLLYLGDFDPAGLLIDQDIAEKMRRHLPGLEIALHRLAITPEQIEQYRLPTKPRKTREKRRPDIEQTVEAEALPAGTMRALLRDAVDGYLDPGIRQRLRVSERAQRESLLSLRGPAP